MSKQDVWLAIQRSLPDDDPTTNRWFDLPMNGRYELKEIWRANMDLAALRKQYPKSLFRLVHMQMAVIIEE